MTNPHNLPWRLVLHDERIFTQSASIYDADGNIVVHFDPDDTVEIDDGAIREVLSVQQRRIAEFIVATCNGAKEST